MKKVRKFIIYNFLPKLVVVLGILIALYPWISDYIYKDKMSSVISEYENSVKQDSKNCKELKKLAQEYNEDLKKQVIVLTDPFKVDVIRNNLVEKYKSSELPIHEGDLVGFVNIPKIDVELPIYYGTTPSVLQSGVGQLECSSLPVEGESVHSVLTGHTGLSDKKLFTDLVQLSEGDLFFVSTFGEKQCFRVYKIDVVLPDDLGSLYTQNGKNLCTLITCTPYGVNSHRLLVTGERVGYSEELEKSQEKAKYISDWKKEYAISILVGLLLAFLIGFSIRKGKRYAKKKKEKVKKNDN